MKKAVLTNFTVFTGKLEASILLKTDSNAGVFL